MPQPPRLRARDILLGGKPESQQRNAPPQAAEAGAPTYTLQIHSATAKPQRGEVLLTGTTHLQDALANAGLTEKFWKLEAVVIRPVPGSFEALTLRTKYDHRKKRIEPDTDFAIQAGDRIVVKEKPFNPVNNALEFLEKNVAGSNRLPR